MRGGPNKGALAALGLAGLIWAYKNRDKIGAKLNEFRNQLPNSSNSEQFNNPSSEYRPFESQPDIPNQNRFGDNYNTTI